MAKSQEEVVCEGWLTKSPPTKRIWRARWRRRWFLLTHSGELPGQYILTYYTDRNCRKLKGVIDLDHCEQVDLGLKLYERKLKFDHVFDIKTPNRTYYLAADSENEMKCWVNFICKVCGLKSMTDEDCYTPMNCSEVLVKECNKEGPIDIADCFSNSPPVSPISTSPYIAISECITGKCPVQDAKGLKKELEYSRNFYRNSGLGNDIYGFSHRSYSNCENLQDIRFYDCPRKLIPLLMRDSDNTTAECLSLLQSPTDSDSIFNEEELLNNSPNLDSSTHARLWDSSTDIDLRGREKFVKISETDVSKMPPPRPPKPALLDVSLNVPAKKSKIDGDVETSSSTNEPQKVGTDETYDIPRSVFVENESTPYLRRQCYNNAVPVNCIEETIFRYDVSLKPGTNMTTIFRYDIDDVQGQPPSPSHSQCSSVATSSNLPSPLIPDPELMSPPSVNRGLKPRRKLSDSYSTSSNPEPASPKVAPSVDRNLKPATPLQEAHMRKHFNVEIEEHITITDPSPTPLVLGRSQDSIFQNEEQIYHCLSGKMQYLDLDLESANIDVVQQTAKVQPVHGAGTVYKEVDFIKTHAFNVTRSNLEKERRTRRISKKIGEEFESS